MIHQLTSPHPHLATREYGIGHSPSEQERLLLQARILGDWTREFITAAGVQPGMRILDIGCGMGDVSLLAAELVGPSGAVVAIDREVRVLKRARSRAQAAGCEERVDFVCAAIESFDDPEPFDGIVGRYVLLYLVDAAATLRRLATLVRAGGFLMFHEFDSSSPLPAYPEAPLWQWALGLVPQALSSIDVAPDFGRRLGRTFLDAGLGWPSMRATVPVGGGPASPMYAWLAETIRTLLPVLERGGLASAVEVDIETLAARLEAEVVGLGAQVMAGAQVAAWARKPSM